MLIKVFKRKALALLGAFRREEVYVRDICGECFRSKPTWKLTRQIQAYGETVQLRYLRENDCQRRTWSPREKSPPVDPDENVLRLQVVDGRSRQDFQMFQASP